ncbi:HAD family hydrolase [Polycladomyces subterraneus]|uniref:HAD family hydrolase n=1 Tax=Polycladomyces subterraneus TaxID=1016997 RepID=A0ABT8IRK3_9BACL|nr:HAD family hydrolase [Polycladomyces subterraneus]MDN4595414.1 HAD family hydrolase [Polycladomyces subterraneus]
MIRALVFDFDGTILDTETPAYLTLKEIYQEYGVELPLDEWCKCIGTRGGEFDPLGYLESCVGRPLDKKAIHQRWRARHQKMVEQQRPLPGVERLLQEAKAKGLKVGLASSSDREVILHRLTMLDLLSHFDCVCTADDVEYVKPDPALYLLAISRLGVRPEEAVAVEDSPNGALAAKRAGLRCLVVPNPMTAGLNLGEYELRLDSLEELTVDSLLDGSAFSVSVKGERR